jgi:FkbM family methyltransferase
MNIIEFTYNNLIYNFAYNPLDTSEICCVGEIVSNNDYILDKFTNNNNKHFIDIGANCGVATIILAKQNPLSTIYSYEPDKNLFNILLKNIELNNLKNVKPFNIAISKSGVDKLLLTLHPNYSGGNTTYSDIDTMKSFFNQEIYSYYVDCLSLDEIIIQNNINEVELLKIDCEGAEYDILYSSVSLKNNIIKSMIGEFHNLKYNKIENTGEQLILYCKDFISNIFKVSILDIK